jgi:hypothetical protein
MSTETSSQTTTEIKKTKATSIVSNKRLSLRKSQSLKPRKSLLKVRSLRPTRAVLGKMISEE